ncbi:D-inositol-3-phosphate glycosyltransferase [Rubripirellula obstinata]|uniref:D-inositol-3-phosphate glycosyltransferase n=2 Tax=Rubripirellula obstinata TaxID=406547 RepID=A0A5B1CL06_9BACT|nr:D-inositol-3-phosphate glycosyltransferase [Rubripirellula obstinata]
MTQSLLNSFAKRDDLEITQVISKSSFRDDVAASRTRRLPFRTDNPIGRLIADKGHNMFTNPEVDLWYYPKGYVAHFCQTSVPKIGTMHDTIVQYYADRYPETRSSRAFDYWIGNTQRSLRKLDRVLTISETAANQLRQFCDRYKIAIPTIDITYEGSCWEHRRGESFQKQGNAVHLASASPHKGTNRLLGLWKVLQERNKDLPRMTLVGKLDQTGQEIFDQLDNVEMKPTEQIDALQQTVGQASVLLLPSEIEGFGLPALEAYYVGTPVCYAGGTSVAEVIDPMGHQGEFAIDDVDDFARSLDWALDLSPTNIGQINDLMYDRFSIAKVTDRIIEAFRMTLDDNR